MSEARSREVKAFGGRSARSAQVFLLPRTQAPPGLERKEGAFALDAVSL